MLVRPITMKPARLSRATTGASASAGAESSSAREPARVTCPLMSNRSLIETGMPANGDSAALALRNRSMASAAPSAASRSTWMKVRWPSPAGSAILAMHCSTSLRAEVAPLARSAAREASVGLSGMAFTSRLCTSKLALQGLHFMACTSWLAADCHPDRRRLPDGLRRTRSRSSVSLQPEIGFVQLFIAAHFGNRAGKADTSAFQHEHPRCDVQEADILLGDQERQSAALQAAKDADHLLDEQWRQPGRGLVHHQQFWFG